MPKPNEVTITLEKEGLGRLIPADRFGRTNREITIPESQHKMLLQLRTIREIMLVRQRALEGGSMNVRFELDAMKFFGPMIDEVIKDLLKMGYK